MAPVRPNPKSIQQERTKTLNNGRIISIHHPNPNQVNRPSRRPYVSHKDQNKHLLPAGYKAYNPDAQNGDWQCPVKGCGELYTRKYAVLEHMRRIKGHNFDQLHDDGDGWYSKISGPSAMPNKDPQRQQQWLQRFGRNAINQNFIQANAANQNTANQANYMQDDNGTQTLCDMMKPSHISTNNAVDCIAHFDFQSVLDPQLLASGAASNNQLPVWQPNVQAIFQTSGFVHPNQMGYIAAPTVYSEVQPNHRNAFAFSAADEQSTTFAFSGGSQALTYENDYQQHDLVSKPEANNNVDYEVMGPYFNCP